MDNPASDNYLTHTRGLRSWLFTLDHKRIGVMYLVSILASFVLGGILALAIRVELMTPGPTILGWPEMSVEETVETTELEVGKAAAEHGPATEVEVEVTEKVEATDEGKDLYNQLFTLHGAVMIFLFIIPGIPAILGNFVLPMMLGAKDVAFPRLNLLSLYLWWFGALFFLGTLALGGLDTGWTFYAPYSTSTDTRVIMAAAGAFILGFSSVFTGLNFVVTVHTMRPAGMTWFRMPLFIWSLYATAIIQVLATPVLAITLLLLGAERFLGIGVFDPALGGDPILFQHFFWFYSHPAVYIMILPGMGIISELVSVFSRKHIFGYRFIAYSSIAIALLGFLVWGHHMFTSGQSALASMIFSALTFSVSIPSAIKVFNWLATMYRGRISLATPMCYALMFIFLFGIGGLTGLFLGALSVDVHLHDTYFIVAHFHYVMFGGTMIAFLGGLHYWWPKMFGRMYSEMLGRLAALAVFVGFNLTFFPQFLLGTRGMPRRYYDYERLLDANPEFALLNLLSSIGSFILAAGLFLILFYLLASLLKGRPAPDNPWGGATPEWQTGSPPPTENFDTPPVVADPYDFSSLRYDAENDCYERVR